MGEGKWVDYIPKSWPVFFLYFQFSFFFFRSPFFFLLSFCIHFCLFSSFLFPFFLHFLLLLPTEISKSLMCRNMNDDTKATTGVK